jgi:hypothetical protein
LYLLRNDDWHASADMGEMDDSNQTTTPSSTPNPGKTPIASGSSLARTHK